MSGEVRAGCGMGFGGEVEAGSSCMGVGRSRGLEYPAPTFQLSVSFFIIDVIEDDEDIDDATMGVRGADSSDKSSTAEAFVDEEEEEEEGIDITIGVLGTDNDDSSRMGAG